MPESTFFVVFGITWVLAMAYALSAFRLLHRVRRLKAEGRGGDAPDPLTRPIEVFGYLGWLLTGRYTELEDAVVTRWAMIARALFVLAAPAILTVFILSGSGLGR